jgi:hypothetical protein
MIWSQIRLSLRGFHIPVLIKVGKDRQNSQLGGRIKAQGELKTYVKPKPVPGMEKAGSYQIISPCNNGFLAVIFCSLNLLAAPTK